MSDVSPLFFFFFFLPFVFLAPNSCRFSLSLRSGIPPDTCCVLIIPPPLTPGTSFFFFLSFFMLGKILQNVCNRTNAHGLTARFSARRCVCVSGICTRHLALPPRERSLEIRRGQSVEARARRHRRSGECVRSFRPSHRETQRERVNERPKASQ